MKQRILFILLIFILGCNKQEPFEYDIGYPKFFYKEFNPPIELGKLEEIEFDIDSNNQNDIKFFIDDNINAWGEIQYGVYVQSISNSLAISYGEFMGSIIFEFLKKSDEFSNDLDWYDFITINGYVWSNWGGGGQMEYLGIRKTKDNRLYAWVRLESTDTTLTIFECFLSNDLSLHVTVGNK